MSLGTMNIPGLASGLDTGSIIEQLMAIERKPYERATYELEELNLKQEAMQEVNTKAFELQSLVFDLTLEKSFNTLEINSNDEKVATAAITGSISQDAEFNITVTKLAKSHTVAGDRLAAGVTPDDDLGLAGGTFSINGTGFTLLPGFSLNDVKDTINSRKEAGVRASIMDNTLVIEAEESGSAGTITFSDDVGTILQDLNIIDGGGAIVNEINPAQDAEVNINGLDITASSNDLTDTVEGLDIKLEGIGTAKLSVSNDLESTVEKVKSFVEKYNETLNMLSDRLEEEKVDDNVIAMAPDYETRNALIKQGQLRNSYTLISFQTELRQTFTGIVNGRTMESIGFKAQGMVGGVMSEDAKRGIVTFDEDAFRQALEDDPNIVAAMFRNSGGIQTSENEYVGEGTGADKFYKLDFRNSGENVKIRVGGTEYTEVSEFTTGVNEFKLDHNTGQIEFGIAPANDVTIYADYNYFEGTTFGSGADYEVGEGTGFNKRYYIGGRNLKDGVGVKVDGVQYKEVKDASQFDADDEFMVDLDTGYITFFKAPDNGAAIRANYEYIFADDGIMWQLNDVLKEVSGIGTLYREEQGINEEIADLESRMEQMETRLNDKEASLWRQWTALERSLSQANSQAQWLSGQLAKLG